MGNPHVPNVRVGSRHRTRLRVRLPGKEGVRLLHPGWQVGGYQDWHNEGSAPAVLEHSKHESREVATTRNATGGKATRGKPAPLLSGRPSAWRVVQAAHKGSARAHPVRERLHGQGC